VLLSAIASKPDWLSAHNTKHFTQAVAKRTGLRITTPAEFFRTLSSLLRKPNSKDLQYKDAAIKSIAISAG
jgi:hypothetical protein